MRDRLVEHCREAPVVDLVHRVPTDALLAHPLELVGPRPRAAQADLHEVVTAHESLGHAAIERRAVRVRDAQHVGAGVGVGVEVDHRVAVGAVLVGERLHHGRRERVVAAKRDRDRAGGPDLVDRGAQARVRGRKVGRRGLDVAVVDHGELGERIDAELHVRTARGRADIVGEADRARAEAGSGAIRRAVVERRADDRDIDADEPCGLEHEGNAAVRQAHAGKARLVGAVGVDHAEESTPRRRPRSGPRTPIPRP